MKKLLFLSLFLFISFLVTSQTNLFIINAPEPIVCAGPGQLGYVEVSSYPITQPANTRVEFYWDIDYLDWHRQWQTTTPSRKFTTPAEGEYKAKCRISYFTTGSSGPFMSYVSNTVSVWAVGCNFQDLSESQNSNQRRNENN